MSNNQHENDIQIGEDLWIEHIDLNGRYDQATNIDESLSDLEDFLQWLEAHCVAGCCGKDAFDFTPEGIINATRQTKDGRLLDKIGSVIDAISSSPTDVILSERMNDYSDRRVAMRLWQHIKKYAEQGAQPDAFGAG